MQFEFQKVKRQVESRDVDRSPNEGLLLGL